VYGSEQLVPGAASSGRPEVTGAPEAAAGCRLTLKRSDGCRSSLGDAGPESRRSDLIDLIDFDEPCLTNSAISPRELLLISTLTQRR